MKRNGTRRTGMGILWDFNALKLMVNPGRIGLATLLMVVPACAFVAETRSVPMPTGDPHPLVCCPAEDAIVVGQGTAFDVGWRYVVFDSDDGLCLQLNVASVASVASMNCGRGMAPEDSVFGALNYGASLDGAIALDGLVSDDVAEVAVRNADGKRFRATLMSLGPAGQGGRAFVAFLPRDDSIESVSAFDERGDLLETYLVPDAPS